MSTTPEETLGLDEKPPETPKKVKYTEADVDALKARLDALPAIERVVMKTRQDVVTDLLLNIKNMQERGYSLDQIAEELSKGNFPIKTTTLKNYLQRAKPDAEPKKATATKKKKATDSNASAPVGDKAATAATSEPTAASAPVLAIEVATQTQTPPTASEPVLASEVATEEPNTAAAHEKGSGSFPLKQRRI
jgi:hypothetical protein